MKEVVELMVQNWEYVVIAILAIDKAVALSPSKWDDLLWTSVKKAIYKVAGKEQKWLNHLDYYKSSLKAL